MLNHKRKKKFFAVLAIILLPFILFVNSLYAVELNTSENINSTLTPTPQYLSVQDIEDGLSDEFNEIKELIVENREGGEDSKLGEALRNIRDDIISSFIWDFWGNPLVTSIFTSLGIFAAAIRNNRSRNDQENGPQNRNQELIDRLLLILMTFSFTYVAIFVLLLLYIAAGQSVSQTFRISELRSIEARIERVESGVNYLTTRTVTPTPTITVTPTRTATPTAYYSGNDFQNDQTLRSFIQYIPLASLILIIMFFTNIVAFYYRKRRIQLNDDENDFINQNLLGFPNRDLTVTILLILILQILPYPADTLLLPFIIQFYVFAFFDLVSLYPSQYLKQIVIKRYSQIIFIAVFGIWLGFSNFVKNFLTPFWYFSRGFIHFGQAWINFLDLVWRLAPFCLAIKAAVPHWRYLKQLSEEKSIPKIIESFEASNTDKDD